MEQLTRKEEQILLAVHFLKDNAMLNTIRERIKRYTGKNYSLGTIYVPLNRLHVNGCLESDLKKVSGSNKPVRYYKITPTGYKALAVLKTSTEEMWDGFVEPVIRK
ncbi:PadR family transcriptional regulator [candidate division KSB1 bacterium]